MKTLKRKSKATVNLLLLNEHIELLEDSISHWNRCLGNAEYVEDRIRIERCLRRDLVELQHYRSAKHELEREFSK